MLTKQLRWFVTPLLVAITLCFVNFALLNFVFEEQVYQSYVFSLLEIYSILLFLTLIVLAIQVYVHHKNPDLSGFVFLATSSVKAVLTYITFGSVFTTDSAFHKFEKINIFFVFIAFLLLEVIFVSKLLKNVGENR